MIALILIGALLLLAGGVLPYVVFLFTGYEPPEGGFVLAGLLIAIGISLLLVGGFGAVLT